MPNDRKVLQQHAPSVFEWVARMWNCRASSLPPKSGSGSCSLEGWRLLAPLVRQILPAYSTSCC